MSVNAPRMQRRCQTLGRFLNDVKRSPHCLLIYTRVFSCGSHTAAWSTEWDMGVGWGGQQGFSEHQPFKELCCSLWLFYSLMLGCFYWGLGAADMNVTTRTAAAPGRQGACTARGGRTAGLQPTARSLQNTSGRPAGMYSWLLSLFIQIYPLLVHGALKWSDADSSPHTGPDAVLTHTLHTELFSFKEKLQGLSEQTALKHHKQDEIRHADHHYY